MTGELITCRYTHQSVVYVSRYLFSGLLRATKCAATQRDGITLAKEKLLYFFISVAFGERKENPFKKKVYILYPAGAKDRTTSAHTGFYEAPRQECVLQL